MAAPASNWQLRESEQVIKGNEVLLGRKHRLVAMTRIRNEALILPDTLDYLASQVDAIIAYDDASTDDTVDILRKHAKVALIVVNQSWEKDVAARKLAEGRHRGLLLEMARSELPHDWMFCFDPDERVTGDLPSFVASLEADASDAVRVQLFDAYMTPEDCAPYAPDLPLLHFRKFWAGAEGHFDAVAESPGDPFRRRSRPDARRHGTGEDRPSLPALWQVALGRSLGGDLRLLHSPLPVRDLREEMDRAQRPSDPHRVRLQAAPL